MHSEKKNTHQQIVKLKRCLNVSCMSCVLDRIHSIRLSNMKQIIRTNRNHRLPYGVPWRSPRGFDEWTWARRPPCYSRKSEYDQIQKNVLLHVTSYEFMLFSILTIIRITKFPTSTGGSIVFLERPFVVSALGLPLDGHNHFHGIAKGGIQQTSHLEFTVKANCDDGMMALYTDCIIFF